MFQSFNLEAFGLAGIMRIMICLGQGGLCSRSAFGLFISLQDTLYFVSFF